jgi:hypothetical protein
MRQCINELQGMAQAAGAPAGPRPARLEAAPEGGAVHFGRWWALHGGLVAAYERECAEFVGWLQPGVQGQRRALKELQRRVPSPSQEYEARTLAHDVAGLLWDISEFHKLHGRAERALEQVRHTAWRAEPEHAAALALCRRAEVLRAAVHRLAGRLRRDEHALAVAAV